MGLIGQLYVLTFVCCLTYQDIYVSAIYALLTHDGPTVQGGTITFQAELFNTDGSKPTGTFDFRWQDDGVPPHRFEVLETTNSTSTWRVEYPADLYPVGEYTVEVIVKRKFFVIWPDVTSQHRRFQITPLLNGNITIIQSNNTVNSEFISSAVETEVKLDLRKGDVDYIEAKATEISTYWFVDCQYYGQTNDYTFRYNFTKPGISPLIEALVVASFEPPTTPSPPTTTTTSTTPSPVNVTTTIAPKNNNSTTVKPPTISTTTIAPVTTTKSPIINATNLPEASKLSNNSKNGNISMPYVCINSSVLPDPKKRYGYFRKEVQVKAPIKNITVEGTNWIKPWDLLNLNVSCHGSGPFYKCLLFHRGNYNITGNETCDKGVRLDTCNFPINHYFLDPTVYTIVVILKNDISQLVYPLTINIYEVTAKPQLSVIVVPVTCSLAAVVLIVFGIAYYLQSRARFTVEVADFDFGQNNPELEYKTFRERLRDSLNSTGYKPLGDPKTIEN